MTKAVERSDRTCCAERRRSAPAARIHFHESARGQLRHRRHWLPLSWRWMPATRPAPMCRWAARACPSSAWHRSPTSPHMFANLGDGTYQHSGILAIRQALAAHARITFKLLFNDAVAMTGGQPAEGAPTVPRIAAQLAAEGVQRIAVVADDADRLPPRSRICRPAPRATHATNSTRCSASCATIDGVVRADLRPGLRDGKAPPAQARLDGAAGAPRRHQRDRSARIAAIARRSRVASRSSRWRPRSAASGASTRQAATSICRA